MLSCNKDKVVIVTHRKRNNDHVLYDKDKKCPLALAGRKSSTIYPGLVKWDEFPIMTSKQGNNISNIEADCNKET